jgi:hypothetical protein
MAAIQSSIVALGLEATVPSAVPRVDGVIARIMAVKYWPVVNVGAADCGAYKSTTTRDIEDHLQVKVSSESHSFKRRARQ